MVALRSLRVGRWWRDFVRWKCFEGLGFLVGSIRGGGFPLPGRGVVVFSVFPLHFLEVGRSAHELKFIRDILWVFRWGVRAGVALGWVGGGMAR